MPLCEYPRMIPGRTQLCPCLSIPGYADTCRMSQDIRLAICLCLSIQDSQDADNPRMIARHTQASKYPRICRQSYRMILGHTQARSGYALVLVSQDSHDMFLPGCGCSALYIYIYNISVGNFTL